MSKGLDLYIDHMILRLRFEMQLKQTIIFRRYFFLRQQYLALMSFPQINVCFIDKT